MAASTLTPALFAFIACRVPLPVPVWCFLGLGAVVALLLNAGIANIWSIGDGRTLRKRVLERFGSQGLAPDAWGGAFVGFSPHPFPRVYDGNYIWDVGFMIPAGERLVYWGEETRFALRRDQTSQIRLGPGHPAWWPSQRLYVTWNDEEKGTTGTFNIVPADSASLRKAYEETATLAERLQAWHSGAALSTPLPSELGSLSSPTLQEVTCLSPRQLGMVRTHLMGSLFVALIALLVSGLFGFFEAGRGWAIFYTIFAAIFAGVALRLPYAFYRDRPA
jgi:hypothetical protein